MSKSMRRAQRRHHAERVKRNRAKYRNAPRYPETPTPCSCHMCANVRRVTGEPTLQEQRWALDNETGY